MTKNHYSQVSSYRNQVFYSGIMKNEYLNSTNFIKQAVIITALLIIQFTNVQLLSGVGHFAEYDLVYFDDDIETSKIDTNSTSTELPETPKDTVIRVPHQRHGSLFILPYRTYKTINKHDLQMQNYNTFSGILNQNLRVFPIDLGNIGSFSSVAGFGGMPSETAMNFNGRPLGDLSFATTDLNIIAPEFMENAQIMVGSDAAIFGESASGMLINIQEIRYNSAVPFTRIWYSQAGNKLIAGDGIFSQNFARDFNFTFGFRNMTSEGRYNNSRLENWNVRTALRWSPTDRLTISLSDVFTDYRMGQNGGVLGTSGDNLYDDITANVMYPNLKERVLRHDITLTASAYLDSDTSSAITSSIYFSNAEYSMNQGRDFFVAVDSISKNKYVTNVVGLNARLEKTFINAIVLRTGADINYSAIPNSLFNEEFRNLNYSAYGHLNFKLAELFNLSGGARFIQKYGNTGIAFGGSLVTSLSDKSAFIADLSFANRMPTASESLQLTPEKHTLVLAEYRFFGLKSKFASNVFFRNILDPIKAIPNKDEENIIRSFGYENAEAKSIAGMFIETEFEIYPKINFKPYIQAAYQLSAENTESQYSYIIAGFNSYYTYTVGRSIMQAGLDFSIMPLNKFYGYNPLNRSFIDMQQENTVSFNGLTAFINLRLGNAFVRAAMENLLSQDYYYLPYYPVYNRNFRMTVSWSFLD